jgi:upstream activation factor subunit UAF30
MSTKKTVECRDFYELMQLYRHAPMIPFAAPSEAYQEVIKFVNEYAENLVKEALEARDAEDADEDDTEPQVQHGFMCPFMPSDILAAIVGKDPIVRTEVTKKVWDYVKANKLQDQTNRRMINADDKLKELFGGKDQVSLFEMTKMISDHLKPV